MIILLIGKPNVGKSTVLARFLSDYKKSVGGIITKEIKDKSGERVGFESVSLTNSQSKLLAKKGLKSKYQIQSSSPYMSTTYGIDITTVEKFILPEIKNSIEKNQLTIIDEIGRMQSFSGKFLDFIYTAFNSKKDILATTVDEPEIWSLRFKNHPAVKLIEVTESNRDNLPQKLLNVFDN